MIFLLIVIEVPLVWLTLKVKTLVWDSDKILPLMMVCLSSSIICWLFYFIFVLYTEKYIVWSFQGSDSYNCTFVWATNLPAYALSLAVILNLNKWIHYLLKIVAFVRVNTLVNDS